MNGVRYIKSFSKGQITIPKQFRDIFGMTGEFWLKMYVDKGRIVAEPMEKEKNEKSSSTNKAEYTQKLLNIKGDWFSLEEIGENRKAVEKQIDKRVL